MANRKTLSEYELELRFCSIGDLLAIARNNTLPKEKRGAAFLLLEDKKFRVPEDII